MLKCARRLMRQPFGEIHLISPASSFATMFASVTRPFVSAQQATSFGAGREIERRDPDRSAAKTPPSLFVSIRALHRSTSA
jgi:hypothetical protein